MSKPVIVFTDAPQDNMIWAFYHSPLGGAEGIKIRIYDYIQKLSLVDFPVNHGFFKNYTYVDKIDIGYSKSLFYDVKMENYKTGEVEIVPIPVGVFNMSITDNFMYSIAYSMFDFFDMFAVS